MCTMLSICCIVAGIGQQITPTVLNEIANKPSYQYTFRVDEFRQLDNILRQVASAPCQSTLRPVVPTPGRLTDIPSETAKIKVKTFYFAWMCSNLKWAHRK